MKDPIFLKYLAKQLAVDKSNLRKYIIVRMGIVPQLAREDGRGQKLLAITEKQANRVFIQRQRDGFRIP